MNIESRVKDVNKFIQGNAWFDFSVIEYSAGNLILHGGIDLAVFRQMEITFKGVLGYYGPFDWKTDTEKTSNRA